MNHSQLGLFRHNDTDVTLLHNDTVADIHRVDAEGRVVGVRNPDFPSDRKDFEAKVQVLVAAPVAHAVVGARLSTRAINDI